MKVLELFAGTRSIGKAFEARGHEVFSVEWNKDFENIDMYADIGKNHCKRHSGTLWEARCNMGEPRLHYVQHCGNQPP